MVVRVFFGECVALGKPFRVGLVVGFRCSQSAGFNEASSWGGVGFCMGLTDMIIGLNADPPVPGVKLIAYVDDIQALFNHLYRGI